MARSCQSCGLVSQTDDACEWCGAVFARPAPPPARPGDTQDEPPVYIEPLGVRLEWFFAAALPVIAVAMALARQSPDEAGELANVASLGVCFVLSLYQIVESVDAQYAPVGLGVVIYILFGPAAVAGIFAAIWLIARRGECWTVLGLAAAHFAARFLVLYAAFPEAGLALGRAGGALGTHLANFSIVLAVAGWALANFWRPLNE